MSIDELNHDDEREAATQGTLAPGDAVPGGYEDDVYLLGNHLDGIRGSDGRPVDLRAGYIRIADPAILDDAMFKACAKPANQATQAEHDRFARLSDRGTYGFTNTVYDVPVSEVIRAGAQDARELTGSMPDENGMIAAPSEQAHLAYLREGNGEVDESDAEQADEAGEDDDKLAAARRVRAERRAAQRRAVKARNA